jgi:hypothetical protein
MQNVADLEAAKESLLESDDAELLRKLEREENSPINDRQTIPNKAEQNPPANKATATPSSGLRYRKTPVEDDIISTRRSGKRNAASPVASDAPDAAKTTGSGSVSNSEDKVEERGDAVDSHAGSDIPSAPPAGELRRRMAGAGAAGNSERTRRIKLEYAKQWQTDKDREQAQSQTQENPDSDVEGNDEESSENSGSVPGEGEKPLGNEFQDARADGAGAVGSSEDTYYFERYCVPRQWSRPVEDVLKCNPDDFQGRRTRSTLYDVMGVSPGASISDIKKTFRLKSLKVHPG